MSYTDSETLSLADLLDSMAAMAITGLCNLDHDGLPVIDWMDVTYWWRIRQKLAELPPRKAHKTKEKWLRTVADGVCDGDPKTDPKWQNWYDAAACLWDVFNDRTPWKPKEAMTFCQPPDIGETARSIVGVAKSKYDRSREAMIEAVAHAGAEMSGDILAEYLERLANSLYHAERWAACPATEEEDAVLQARTDGVMDDIFAIIAPKRAQWMRIDARLGFL